jgi:predicted GNAT superfamily acetyltransferase
MAEPTEITIKVIDTPEEMADTQALSHVVWGGDDVEIVPVHILLAMSHNGGVCIGAYDGDTMVGFVHGFLGFTSDPDKPVLKHHSHQLGVHPDYRSYGLGYRLKRAQWQMVRKQGLELITWTYDPLMSTNANLNIAKLGAVCDTYKREVYGNMRDSINVGLPSDRFQVDWWVNSTRVYKRLSREPRRRLDLAHFLAADAHILNPAHIGPSGFPVPPDELAFPIDSGALETTFILVEIPSDFLALKEADPELALNWRVHTRLIFENLFPRGYITTDFVYLTGTHPRSFYVLSRGDTTLGD